MIKKILYLIIAINIFSLTEYEKEILKKQKIQVTVVMLGMKK